jgi:hypothetical protein
MECFRRKLTLSSPTGVLVTYANFVAAIKDVVFSNSSTNPSGSKFSINLGIGKASYLPRNGHFMNISQNLELLGRKQEKMRIKKSIMD